MNKELDEMNLNELQKAYLKELESYKESIPNETKYNWLRKIGVTEEASLNPLKVATARGYLLALRDCGKRIGDLKMILEFISIEIED